MRSGFGAGRVREACHWLNGAVGPHPLERDRCRWRGRRIAQVVEARLHPESIKGKDSRHRQEPRQTADAGGQVGPRKMRAFASQKRVSGDSCAEGTEHSGGQEQQQAGRFFVQQSEQRVARLVEEVIEKANATHDVRPPLGRRDREVVPTRPKVARSPKSPRPTPFPRPSGRRRWP